MSAGDATQGRRVYDLEPHLFAVGDYGRWQGEWYGSAPGDLLAGLSRHQVAEHEDGTITVSPSILVGMAVVGREGPSWHGYLERGVWREI